jgi:hypothetical protein
MSSSAARVAQDLPDLEYQCVLLRPWSKPQQISVLASLLLHLAPLLYLQYPLWMQKAPVEPKKKEFVQLILPFDAERPKTAAAESGAPKLPIPTAPSAVTAIVAEEPSLQRSTPSPDEIKVNMASAEIVYRDPDRQLPVILSRYRGYVGFGPMKERGEYVRRVFSVVTRENVLPPGAAKAVDDFCYILIDGGGYPLVDSIRREHHLDNDQAYACFPSVFAEEVSHTVKKAVLKDHGGGKIKSVTVIISSDAPNGLVAGEVVMAKESQ